MGELTIERILVNFGIPVFICVVLPVVVVWLVTRAKQNETNRKAEIMLKAIEAGVPVDMEQFKSAQKKAPVSIKQDLLEKLNGVKAKRVAVIHIKSDPERFRMLEEAKPSVPFELIVPDDGAILNL